MVSAGPVRLAHTYRGRSWLRQRSSRRSAARVRGRPEKPVARELETSNPLRFQVLVIACFTAKNSVGLRCRRGWRVVIPRARLVGEKKMAGDGFAACWTKAIGVSGVPHDGWPPT